MTYTAIANGGRLERSLCVAWLEPIWISVLGREPEGINQSERLGLGRDYQSGVKTTVKVVVVQSSTKVKGGKRCTRQNKRRRESCLEGVENAEDNGMGEVPPSALKTPHEEKGANIVGHCEEFEGQREERVIGRNRGGR